MKVKCDKETQRWLEKNLVQQTTVMKCEKCGLFYKLSLGHKCKNKNVVLDKIRKRRDNADGKPLIYDRSEEE